MAQHEYEQESLDQVLEVIPNAIISVNREGNIAFLNQRAEALFGYSRNDLLSHPLDRLIPERFRPMHAGLVTSFFTAPMARPMGVGRDLYGLHKDGREIPIEISLAPMRTPGGPEVLVIIADITVRKQTEAALRESEDRFHLVMETLTEVFWMADPAIQKMKYISPGYEKIWGRTRQSLYEDPRSFLEAIHCEDRARVLTDLQVQASNLPFDHEYRIVTPEGKTRWIWDRGFPVPSASGQVDLYVGVASDITARKQIEEALRRSQEELRQYQAQLQDLTGKLITVQEEERQRLAGELHDDFSQRLAALALDLQRLSSQVSASGAISPFDLNRLGKKVQQLMMDLQRLAQQLHPSILDHLGLEEAMREQAEEFETRTAIKTMFIVQAMPQLVPIKQATCLYRILQEALQNVRKHAQATQVTIRLIGTPDGLSLIIHDDGQGLTGSSNRKKGLGLINMKERVRVLHGSFHVRSEPGSGTEINIWIPFGENS